MSNSDSHAQVEAVTTLFKPGSPIVGPNRSEHAGTPPKRAYTRTQHRRAHQLTLNSDGPLAAAEDALPCVKCRRAQFLLDPD